MQTQSRIVGSGFTAFFFQHQLIAFLDDINDSGQAPIVQYQAVTPLGAEHPAEFALPRVRAEGTLQFTVRELWNQPVWWQLGQKTVNTVTQGTGPGTYFGTWNIVDVYNAQANTPTPIVCATVITIPGANGRPAGYRGWVYNNFVLTQIDDREQVQIGSLTMPRTLQGVYAYKTPLANTSGGVSTTFTQ